MNLSLVVLAAGASRRFGAANKLLQLLDGKPLLCHTLELAAALPVMQRAAVCSVETAPLAEAAGFTVQLQVSKFSDYKARIKNLNYDLYIGEVKLPPAGRATAACSSPETSPLSPRKRCRGSSPHGRRNPAAYGDASLRGAFPSPLSSLPLCMGSC